MDMIDDLVKLDTLKSQISSARNNVVPYQPRLTWQMTMWDTKAYNRAFSNACDGNNSAYEVLPKEIKVSPEIALLLCEDQFAHDSRQAILDKESRSKGLYHVLVLSASSIAAGITTNPHSLMQMATSWADMVKAGNEIGAKYAKLWEQRDQTSTYVLQSYLLSEDGVGGYVLKRGHWQVVDKETFSGRGTSTHSELELQDVGISSQLDKSKLPNPEIRRGGVAG